MQTFHTQAQLARRYGVSCRSVLRWREAGRFPAPDTILPNGRAAWSIETIEANERRAVAHRKSSATASVTSETTKIPPKHLSKHDSDIIHRAVYDGRERLGSVEERGGHFVAHNRRNAEIGVFNTIAAAAIAVWQRARGQS